MKDEKRLYEHNNNRNSLSTGATFTHYPVIMRVVLDTNVLVDAFSDDFSPQAKLIDAVREGDLDAVYTRALEREYRKILRRLISDSAHHDKISEFIAAGDIVQPRDADVVIDDQEDYKIIQAAVGGDASVIVSSDRHLLDIGEIGSIKVLTPQEAWVAFSDEQGDSGEWTDWIKGLGIGR